MSGESNSQEEVPVNGKGADTNGGGGEGDNASESAETRAAAAAKRAFLEVSDAQKYKQFMLKPPETKKLKASEALSRVKDFLPLLKQSTDKLLVDYKENPDEVNIENVDDEDEHIEMNLALVSEDSDDSDDDDEDEEDEEDESSDEDESEEETSEEGEGDDDTVTKKPRKKDGDQYLDLDLGFKVKDPSKIEKLKLPTTSKMASGKRPLIQIIDQNTADDDDDDDGQEDDSDHSDHEEAK